MPFKPYVVKPIAPQPRVPHVLTRAAEAHARAFVEDRGGGRAVVHLSQFHCALMATSGRLIDGLRELYERRDGGIADTLAAFDKLQAILVQERVFAQDVATVRGMMAAEGKLPVR